MTDDMRPEKLKKIARGCTRQMMRVMKLAQAADQEPNEIEDT